MKIGNKHFYFCGRYRHTSPKSLEDLAIIARAEKDHYVHSKAKEFVRLLQSGEHMRHTAKYGYVFLVDFRLEIHYWPDVKASVEKLLKPDLPFLVRKDDVWVYEAGLELTE